MYLMYVDETGDVGLSGSPTRYFVLTGLVVHELHWKTSLDQLVAFRRRMKSKFGLLQAEEIHAAAMINKPGKLVRIKRNDRLTILREFADELATIQALNIINVVVDKQGKPQGYDAFDAAWTALIQRFENTMGHRNFPGPPNPNERGIVFPDQTDERKLRILFRRLRHFNTVPNQARFGPGYRNLSITTLVEDPNLRNSAHSYFIQAADLATFLLYQSVQPCQYFRQKGARRYFFRLKPILCTVASNTSSYGIVKL